MNGLKAIIDSEKPSMYQMQVHVQDNGCEVLWGESTGEFYRVMSVPVFAYDLSRGTIVSASFHDDRLQLTKVINASAAGTIRCYLERSSRIDDGFRR